MRRRCISAKTSSEIQAFGQDLGKTHWFSTAGLSNLENTGDFAFGVWVLSGGPDRARAEAGGVAFRKPLIMSVRVSVLVRGFCCQINQKPKKTQLFLHFCWSLVPLSRFLRHPRPVLGVKTIVLLETSLHFAQNLKRNPMFLPRSWKNTLVFNGGFLKLGKTPAILNSAPGSVPGANAWGQDRRRASSPFPPSSASLDLFWA